MQQFYQIPRSSLAWLILAVVSAILPQTQQLPIWIFALALFVLVWRVMVFLGRWNYPGKVIKTFLVAVAVSGIFKEYGTIIGPEAGVALLTLIFLFKLLEMHQQRDAYIIVFLAYFVAATAFLISTSLAMSAYILWVVLLITTALVGLNQNQNDDQHTNKPGRAFKAASVVLAQAIPLMIVLFLLVPRFPPLWSVKWDNQETRIGMSDYMSPGSVSELSVSDELVFRAVFNGFTPRQQDRYWRGLTLSQFNGRSWSKEPAAALTKFDTKKQKSHYFNQLKSSAKETGEARGVLGGDIDEVSYSYQIMLEPHDRQWLFALDTPLSLDSTVTMFDNSTITSKDNVESLFVYNVKSYPNISRQILLSPAKRNLYLQLPEKGNEKSRAFAMRNRAKVATDEEYISVILAWFNQEEFVYTLKPPLLDKHVIDGFLFETRRGFCGHYSSAFSVLMRAAGIPSRVVVGYLGGERSSLGDYILVHQYDAHAWVEVWLAGKGWQRVDPTGAVAPDRIEFDLQEALKKEGSFLQDSLVSLNKYKKIKFFSNVRHWIDYMDYSWQKVVLGYSDKEQAQLFKGMFGSTNLTTVMLVLLISMGSILGLIAFVLLWEKKGGYIDPAQRYYLQFVGAVSKAGLEREAADSISEYANKVKLRWPEKSTEIDLITKLYVRLRYERLPGQTKNKPFNEKSQKQYQQTLNDLKVTTKKFSL